MSSFSVYHKRIFSSFAGILRKKKNRSRVSFEIVSHLSIIYTSIDTLNNLKMYYTQHIT